ncbi:Protein of unknown function, putative, partial [Plasmodium vivax]
GNHSIYLNMNYFKGNTWKVRNDRLLTNDDPKSKIGQSGTSDNITLPVEQNLIKDITGSSEIYEKINKNISNSMHAYINKLEHGYTNKKGLKRLDYYYEKKLFDEMYKLDKISGHMKSKNSYFKKVIFKRYGLRFFIFSLVILLGITASIVCNIANYANDDTGKCYKYKTSSSHACNFLSKYIIPSNSIIHMPIIIAYLSFIIYILTKVRKYKRLKKKFSK